MKKTENKVSIAQQIRTLYYKEGKTKSEISKLLDKRYQHVYNVIKSYEDGLTLNELKKNEEKEEKESK